MIIVSGMCIFHFERGYLKTCKSFNPVFFLFTQKVKELYHQYQSKFCAFFSHTLKKKVLKNSDAFGTSL